MSYTVVGAGWDFVRYEMRNGSEGVGQRQSAGKTCLSSWQAGRRFKTRGVPWCTHKQTRGVKGRFGKETSKTHVAMR